MSGSEFTSEFFALGSTHDRWLMHARPLDDVSLPEQFLRGEVVHAKPLQFEVISGTDPADLISCSLVALRLISTALVEALERSRLTGWFSYPIVLEHKGIPMPGYSGLGVNGACGPIDPAKARIELMPPGAPGGITTFAARGIAVDRHAWDGIDFFIPQGSSVICVTPKAADVLSELSGVRLTPLDQYTIGLYDFDPRKGPPPPQ